MEQQPINKVLLVLSGMHIPHGVRVTVQDFYTEVVIEFETRLKFVVRVHLSILEIENLPVFAIEEKIVMKIKECLP